MSEKEYGALSRTDGGWVNHGTYPTEAEARSALSRARACGDKCRIIERTPGMIGDERIIDGRYGAGRRTRRER